MEKVLEKWYEENGQYVKDLAKELWLLAETALEEYESCKITAAFM